MQFSKNTNWKAKMKNGTTIAEEFFYSYASLEHMDNQRNCDLLEKITKKSTNLFVRGETKYLETLWPLEDTKSTLRN